MLIDNTLFLREHFPEVRKYFLENEENIDLDLLDVLDSKTGQKTLRYKADMDKGLMVHSKYDPIREAERILASHQERIGDETHVFFFGVGMGYHIEKFKELFPNNSYSIYEPLPEIFSSMAQNKLLNSIMTRNMKHLYLDTHETESDDFLEEFSTNNKDMHLIILPSYENIVKEKVTNFREKIKKVIQNRRTGLHTNTKFQKLWVTNSLMNFNEVLKTPNMMKDIERTQFEGKPALIVSAGPSLAEDLGHIRYIKENDLAYIFAVGSAINSLITHDVLPDAVCTYDPGELNHEVYKKMIENKIDHIPMVFGSSVGYETLTRYQGPKVHFITTQDRTSIYFLGQQLNTKQDLIHDSPSIAVMTFQLLNKLGANPIIFAGQNLGYLYDQLYSEGIEYENLRSSVDEKQLENAINTEDVYGNAIKTNLGFNNMRVNLEGFAKMYKGRTFINTTKGGAAIQGVPFQPIEEVIQNFLTQSIAKEKWWIDHNSYNQSKLFNQKEILENSISEFHGLIIRYKKLLDTISIHTKLKNKQQLENSLIQFDKLYEQLMQNVFYTNFLSFYIRVHVEFMSNEIKRLNQVRDIYKKGEEIVQSFSIFLVRCDTESRELERIIADKIGE
ncbi:motility associated factor glycosyltransferase family protein [Virgibacillus sp. JSM 102003]|uniref:motility associated factor glycosyltransferase family protein n=1 Tax=Virgibacillus sp. JSM 102003 TaxID=1562108 RepID=UPI0035C0DA97